jgi:hypothetical protein
MPNEESNRKETEKRRGRGIKLATMAEKLTPIMIFVYY